MTLFDYLKSCSKEEMARFLCQLYDGNPISNCGYCPAKKYCWVNHNGYKEKYLDLEWDDKFKDVVEEDDEYADG